MKKWVYYLMYLLLLLAINSLPVSAKEILTCTRSTEDLKVREEFNKGTNREDILATPCVDSSSKIYDFADLLTDQEEENLYLEVQKFIESNNYDLVIVTINENNKGTAASYADDFYDYNDFGKNDSRDGLLFLIDMDTRELYISTTGEAIKMYDDYRIENILDAGYPYLSMKEYYRVFKEMISEADYYFLIGMPDSNSNLDIDRYGNVSYRKIMPLGLIVTLSIIITVIVAVVCYFKTRLKIKAIDTVSYLKSKNLKIEKDIFINSFVTHRPRSTDTSSSSGSSSSHGSSIHTSSSGSSHGGGGRHF